MLLNDGVIIFDIWERLKDIFIHVSQLIGGLSSSIFWSDF